MKPLKLALVTLCMLLMGSYAMGQAYIEGSAHDFAANGYSWADGEICKPCHTPHNAVEPEVSEAIWSHTLSTASYTMPGGAVLTQDEALDPYSRLCMGCHDGTVALDSFAGGAGTSGPFGAASIYNIGTDLSNDHPVGNEILYPDAGSSRFNPTVPLRGGKGVGTNDPSTGKAILPLRENTDGTSNLVVSCGSCHNPHGSGNGTARYEKLLRMSNQESQMCLTCHIK